MTSDLQQLFEEQHSLINQFFKDLDYTDLEKFSILIQNCSGIIYLSGMGKSGIIAQNISQMLVSTGTRAMFLDPVNALHGDVGIVGKNDVVVLFSRSGQTGELLNLIPAIRNKGATLVSVVSNRTGLIAKQADLVVYLPLEKELCPFDMAPTTSAIIQLIFGNTIVAYLMKKTGLTKEAYALNHPAGRIGKRLTMRVEDVMRPLDELPLCDSDDLLLNKIGKMSAKRCGNLIIHSNGILLGIFTDGDLRRAIETKGSAALDMTVGELMTKNPATTMRGLMAYQAMQEMEKVSDNKKRVKELPVVDDQGKIEGMLVLHDLVQYGL